MPIDVSAVARVLGIDVTYKDLRAGRALFLPQRIALFAQGETGVSFSTEKYLAPSAGAAGNRFGFRSPIYQCLKQLMPVNGDGVGTIPVTVYSFEDDDAGVAATADITLSGTAARAASYRVRISGVLSLPFVIAAGVVNVTEVCRNIGEAIAAVIDMPMTVSYAYGIVAAAPAAGNVGNGTCTALSVTGTPTPGDYRLTCTAAVLNGGVFSLRDPDGALLSSVVTMTPGVGAATALDVAGIGFTLTDGATDFAPGDAFTITVPASKVELTAAWKGESGNDLVVELLGDSVGIAFAITQPNGGLVNPDVSSALAQMGNVWETLCLNALNIADTTALDAFQSFGEGRWGALVRKPLVVFTGNTESDVADATAVSSARRTDRVNAQLVAPGSVNLPCVVAARQLAKIARIANNAPATDYGAEQATGLIPGTDGQQWDYPTRDQAVKAGSSTVEVNDGVVTIGDVVTFYRPSGEEPPAYRYVVDVIKLQQLIYNVSLVFAARGWAGAPLIPDDQPTVAPDARKASSAVAAVNGVIDTLALNAILSNPKAAKKATRASIDAQNPKRLNVTTTVQLSGNTNVKGIDLSWGFFFGG